MSAVSGTRLVLSQQNRSSRTPAILLYCMRHYLDLNNTNSARTGGWLDHIGEHLFLCSSSPFHPTPPNTNCQFPELSDRLTESPLWAVYSFALLLVRLPRSACWSSVEICCTQAHC